MGDYHLVYWCYHACICYSDRGRYFNRIWDGLELLLFRFLFWVLCLQALYLAFGEAGNFPAAIKATAEYFPKKERSFATGIFNSGANVGAILAPLTVPWIADNWGWESAFIIIGAIGFLWLIFLVGVL